MTKNREEYGAITIRYVKDSELGKVIENFSTNAENKSLKIRELIYFSHGDKCMRDWSQEEVRNFLIAGISFFSGKLAALESHLKIHSKYSEFENRESNKNISSSAKDEALATLINSFKL